MATPNKRKLAVLNKENCEEHPRSNLAQNSTASRSQEDYITQLSEVIEGRVTKKLSQEFSRTKNRILGALASLDDFLMNPLLQGHSGITPATSRNVFSINQGTNEDESQWPSSWRGPSHLWPRESSRHGDRSSERECLRPRHADRSAERKSVPTRHGDRSYRTDSQPTWHADRSSRGSYVLLP